MNKFFLISLILAVILTLGSGQLAKIDQNLFTSLSTRGGNANIFISMKDGTSEVLQKVRSNFKTSTTHGEKTTVVHSALKKFTEKSQFPVLEFLQKFPDLEFTSYWISNVIYLKNANLEMIQKLADLDQVGEITEEPTSHIGNFVVENEFESFELSPRQNTTNQWGLEKMQVPQVWEMEGGNNGGGIIIGNIDTGVRGSHELLRDKWVGLDNNGWYDPENKTSVPHDVYNHGTHVTGTLIGDHGMGVCPGGRWLACKGYRNDGTALASTFLSCMQYMACPSDFNGENEDCSKAPHVVSNSWGWSGGYQFFNPAINAWIAASILSSFSAGNTGPGCSSIYAPADQDMAVAVGATDSLDRLASFSSRGPSLTFTLKPEISAPGVGIVSASAASDQAYSSLSGTSMSCPHASAVMALLKTYDLNLSHADALEVLQITAEKDLPTTGGTCNEVPDVEYPNNHFGHGRINAFKAIQALMDRK